MKILFLNIYQNKVNRGAETFVLELGKRLSKNHEVEIISGEGAPARWKNFLWRLFLDPNGLAVAGFTLKNIPRIWKGKYDIVVPLNGGWQVALIRIVTWLRGAKMIVSGQSGIGWDDRNNLWSFPNAFVALSSKALAWARRVNPLVRSVYISNGVDLDKFKNERRKLITGGKTVLCAGAFTLQKRLDLAIKAVFKLKGVNLIIAGGGGEMREELQELGGKLLGDRFKIISVPFEKMPEVYASADVFTLPSTPSEAFGNVLVEAMASGLPVVATNDLVRREIVGEAGILVDPTDTETYAKALREALKTNWGEKPRKQAEKFNWDKIAEQYEELFNSI